MGIRKAELFTVQSKSSVRIKQVEFSENVRAFFYQGQSELSEIMRRPY